MFNNFTIGKYYPIESKLHNLNPLTKIMCTFMFLIGILITNNIILYILLTIFTIILIYMSNVPIKYFLNNIKSLRILIIFIFVFDLIIKGSILQVSITILRIILIVMYTSLLTYTTSPNAITYGLEKIFSFLKRFKVPVHNIVLTLSLALRFIPIIFEQARKIIKSQASRGIDFNYINIKGKLLALQSMLVPLMLLSSKRANDLATSMEMRLYGYYPNRTKYRFTPWTEIDNTLVVIHFGILIFIILSEVIMI